MITDVVPPKRRERKPSKWRERMHVVAGRHQVGSLSYFGEHSTVQTITVNFYIRSGINRTVNKTTSAVPSEVFFGYRIQTDSDKLVNDNEEQHIDVTSLRNAVNDRININASKQKQLFDSKRKPARIYDVNDLVVIKIPSQSNDGQSTKLMPLFKGPFQVIEVLGQDRYKVKDMRGAERTSKRYEGTTCVENMKPWIRLANWDKD